LIEQIFVEHPDYLFGKLNKANKLIEESSTTRLAKYLESSLKFNCCALKEIFFTPPK
jgi:hypothetical protein